MERGGKEQRKGTDGNYLHEEEKTGKLSAKPISYVFTNLYCKIQGGSE